jgi:hypothetical protein
MKIAPAPDPVPIRVRESAHGDSSPSATPSIATVDERRRWAFQQSVIHTPGIDWAAQLGPSAIDPTAVYYDGLVLRNAAAMSIAQAHQAIETRIAAVLREAGHADLVAKAPLFRFAIMDEPVLWLPPGCGDIEYGSREWSRLIAAMQAAPALGLQAETMDRKALMMLGGLATALVTRHGPGELAQHGALIRMARAQGRLEPAAGDGDRAQAGAEAANLAERLAAFVQEEFELDLAFTATLAELARGTMPSRYETGQQLLRQAGIDLDRTVSRPEMFDPDNLLAHNPARSAQEHYFNYDRLTVEDVQRLLPGASAQEVQQVHARIPPSLDAEFGRRFDQYKQATAASMARAVELSIAMLARDHGIVLNGKTISVFRPKLEHYENVHVRNHGAVLTYKRLAASRPCQGYVLMLHEGIRTDRYFVSYTGGGIHELPGDRPYAEWAMENIELVFGKDPGPPPPAAWMAAVQTGEPVVARPAQLQDRLRPVFEAEIEALRESLRGQTPAEESVDHLLGLIPFRNAIVALGKGEYLEAALFGMVDLLALVPLVAAGVRAGATVARIGAAAVRTLGMPPAALRRELLSTVAWHLLGPRTARAYAAAVRHGAPRLATALEAHAARSAANGSAASAAFSTAMQRAATRDVVLTASLDALRPGTGGVVALQGASYARVPAGYVPIRENHALSLPGRAVWDVLERRAGSAAPLRIWHDPATDVWQALAELPGLHGGGKHSELGKAAGRRSGHAAQLRPGASSAQPPSVLRDPHAPALAKLERVALPRSIPNAYIDWRDVDGTLVQMHGHLSRSRTVRQATALLDQVTDTQPLDWGKYFPKLFDVRTDAVSSSLFATLPADVRPTVHQVLTGSSDSFHALFAQLSRSPTFNGLVNLALRKGRLGPHESARWTLHLEMPQAIRDGLTVYSPRAAAPQPRTIPLLVEHLPGEAGKFYFNELGIASAKQPQRVNIENIVRHLFEIEPPGMEPWLRNGQIDPATFATQGLGERGGLGYLVDRIMYEAGFKAERYLSQLVLRDLDVLEPALVDGEFPATRELALAIADRVQGAGGLDALRRYVEYQDRYLHTLYPLGHVQASGPGGSTGSAAPL